MAKGPVGEKHTVSSRWSWVLDEPIPGPCSSAVCVVWKKRSLQQIKSQHIIHE